MAHRAGTGVLSAEGLPPKAVAFVGRKDKICAIYDVSGSLLAANQRYFEAVRRPADELIGRYFWDFMEPESVDSSLRALDRVSMSGSVRGFVNCWRRGDGGRVCLSWDCDQAGSDGLLYASADIVDPPAL